MALRLKRKGIERVRPLAGGLVGWRARGYPVELLARERASLLQERAPAAAMAQE